MRLNVLKAYLFKEFIELFRSKLLTIVYIMPTMILLLFGYGIKMEVTHARTLVIDNDQSTFSRLLVSKFEHSKYFDTIVKHLSETEALHRIKQAKTDIVIIIPSSMERRLLHGQKSEIGVFVDGAFPTRAVTMQNYVEGVILDTTKELARKKLTTKALIVINQRTLFNQAMRDEDAIVPGLIGLVMLVAPAILAALLIVKEKEQGTIFNFYASPLRRSEFLIAKLLPVFVLHSFNVFILYLWARYLFEVPFRGSFLLYLAASELYILVSIGIGLLISIVTSRQIVAVILTVIITIIPGFLYSGMLMPISSMEGESYIEAHLFPVMYYTHIVYDTFLIGQGLDSPKNLLYLGILALYGAVLLLLGSAFLKKELK